MLNLAVILLAVLAPILLATAFLLGRHFHRREDASRVLSAVTRQHIELFQGGQLSETAVEAAKSRFRDLLERGDWRTVEASLRPGTHFVIQVRALAEIGTDEAGRILERQLQRRLTQDKIEQSWYWIDLAHGLRNLQREQSLPQLLRCADASGEHPLSHFFAAETICFLSFASYLHQPGSPLGRAALRVLQSALEGLRCGVPPQVVNEARLGELIENLWEHKPESAHPLVVRVISEAVRLLERAGHFETLLSQERYEQEAFSWQLSHLAALEPVLTECLSEAPVQLCRALPTASPSEQKEILTALVDLRAECAEAVLPLLKSPEFSHAELAVGALTWSKHVGVGPWLREWALEHVSVEARTRRRFLAPLQRLSVPSEIPYLAVLRALRGHPSQETEEFLILAARDCHPSCRSAALSSLGWWEPLAADTVTRCLHQARRDPYRDVRQSARAALARLGECQALQWYRSAITSQDPIRVHEAIQATADEGLLLLWPDLDHLTDCDNVDVSIHAREALERMREEMRRR